MYQMCGKQEYCIHKGKSLVSVEAGIHGRYDFAGLQKADVECGHTCRIIYAVSRYGSMDHFIDSFNRELEDSQFHSAPNHVHNCF